MRDNWEEYLSLTNLYKKCYEPETPVLPISNDLDPQKRDLSMNFSANPEGVRNVTKPGIHNVSGLFVLSLLYTVILYSVYLAF